MSGLPAGWCEAGLLDLAGLIRGVTYTRSEARDQPFKASIPILRATNIVGRGFDLSNLVYVPEHLVSSQQKIKSGDVVVATSSGSISVVGKGAQAKADMRMGFGAFCGLLRPRPEIDQHYFGHYFSSEQYRAAVSKMARGVNINNLKRDHFKSLIFPLAPLPEQKRIADKLDVLLARVDTCRERLDRVPGILKRFRQAVLASATNGELTREWREERGLAESGRTLEFGDDSLDVPGSWKQGELAELLDPLRPLCYGVVQPGEVAPRGPLLVRVQDLSNGTIVVEDLRTISKAIDREYKRSRVRGGDVLVSVVGTIGRISIVPKGFKGNIARAIARLACGPNVLPEWIRYWLENHIVQWWLVRSSREVARKTLNLSELSTTPVAVPSIEEQTEIVRLTEELLALFGRLENRLNAARRLLESSTPRILGKGFRGELVPQDPNDEPALELLAKVKAQGPVTIADPQRKRSKASKEKEMRSTVKELVKATILKMRRDRFSFAELRSQIASDYESLKDALFELLEEDAPVVRQVFDKREKTMRLERVRL